jgi:hypothetical protein
MPKGFHFVKSLMKKGYLKFFMMGYIKQIVVLILTAGSSCASKQNNNMDFPQEIAAVYFKKQMLKKVSKNRG